MQLQVSICSDGPQPEKLVIDCAVHHVKANGSGTAKVFKGWSLELAPVAERTLVKHPSFRPITTREHRAGRHVVDLRVNIVVMARSAFDLTV